jgi:ABC-type transport system involved in multi-copper enzyme maturation permease subunit
LVRVPTTRRNGHARQSLQGDPSWGSKAMLLLITFFIPDLSAFNISDAIVVGDPVAWNYVWKTVGYACFYTLITLVVAYLIFEEKEI